MPEAFVMAGEITKEFAQNRADHEEINKRLAKLVISFEKCVNDIEVLNDGIQGLNQRLDELRVSVDKLAERVTLLELRLQCA